MNRFQKPPTDDPEPPDMEQAAGLIKLALEISEKHPDAPFFRHYVAELLHCGMYWLGYGDSTSVEHDASGNLKFLKPQRFTGGKN